MTAAPAGAGQPAMEPGCQDLLETLALVAEYREDPTGQHAERVGRLTRTLCLSLGLEEPRSALLGAAAKLHDLGKIAIPDSILLKPGRLNSAEFDILKTHTTLGHQFLSRGEFEVIQAAREIALHHHECWDGSGYPCGLRDRQIPLPARIVAVADVLDALTHERPYRKPFPLEVALEFLRERKSTQFDPEVVNSLLEAFGSGGVLCDVEVLPRRTTSIIAPGQPGGNGFEGA